MPIITYHEIFNAPAYYDGLDVGVPTKQIGDAETVATGGTAAASTSGDCLVYVYADVACKVTIVKAGAYQARNFPVAAGTGQWLFRPDGASTSIAAMT